MLTFKLNKTDMTRFIKWPITHFPTNSLNVFDVVPLIDKYALLHILVILVIAFINSGLGLHVGLIIQTILISY